MSPRQGVALVTGAAQGIGRSIALRLADDGFDIAVNDISTKSGELGILAEEIHAKGRASSLHVADVSQEEQVKVMVEQATQRHAGLDVVGYSRVQATYRLHELPFLQMFANAGVIGVPGMSFTEVPIEEWDRVMNTNARGTFLCYKYAGIQMIKQGRGGRIIGASSVGGKQGRLPGPYSASKFAVRGLTQAAALEFGAHGITVNAYAPGAIDTPMCKCRPEISDILPKSNSTQSGKTPEDVAHLVSFLVSKESQFVTGQTVYGVQISVNGGIWFD
ncbi:NAD-binding protein [Mycena galericulata]|nr:NAD-binding protein [Mycena galericulata]